MSLFDPISELFGITGEDPGAGYNKAGLDAINSVDIPDIEQLKVKLQQMVYQGDMTPEQANNILQDPTALKNMSYGTEGKSAQLQALNQLQGIAEDGGMTSEDKANLNDVRTATGADDRGRREAITQNFRERGMGGSGMDLVAQLQGAQDSATNENKAGLDVSKMAQARALEAIQQSGQLGGQIEGQNFGEASKVAEAQDAINKFNTQAKQQVESANVATRNAALDRNMQEKQRIADANAGIVNDQAKTNAGAAQTVFQDKMSKAGGVAGADQALAAGKTSAANAKTAFEGQLLNTAGTVGGGYLASKAKPTYIVSDERKKKDIKGAGHEDIMDFLASMDPKTFEYKDGGAAPGESPGENLGVLAQDMEKSKLGKDIVEDGPGGKTINVKKGLSALFAALAALHDEVKEDHDAA